MKKLIFTALTIGFLCPFASSQALVAGVKGIYNSTWLLNSHVSNAAATDQSYVPSFGYSYGVSGALFLSKKFGVEMNVLYATHSQQYEGDQYTSETSLEKIDVPILLKFQSKTKVYLELGIQYALVSKASYYYNLPPLIEIDENISEKVAKNSIDGVLGIGIELDMFLGLAFNAGMRFTGSLTDMEGVDALGFDLSDPLNLNLAYNGNYEPTHSLCAGFLVGFTYSIGRKE